MPLALSTYLEQLGRYLDCDDDFILKQHHTQENCVFVLGLGYV
jgi:hypothetical protein